MPMKLMGSRIIRLPAILSVAFAVLASGFMPAAAETLSFRVKNDSPHVIELAFYSMNRAYEWPGNNQAWVLKDNLIHTFRLTCQRGEDICLGAWQQGNRNRYWGMGFNADHECENCCYYCNGQTTDIKSLYHLQ